MRSVVNFSLLAANDIEVELVALDVSMLDVVIQLIEHRGPVVRQSLNFLVWNRAKWLTELESIILHLFHHRDPVLFISASICLVSFV